jgi:ABC-2 type transport system ATP-binding protein
MTGSVAVEAMSLGKTYPARRKNRSTPKVAVHDVDLTISAGESVALLGPNGAGKSTLMKMMAGVLEPSAGELKVLGRTPTRERIAHTRQIGVVFGQRSQLWPDVSLDRSFDLLRRIHRIPRSVVQPRIDELCEMLLLSGQRTQRARTLSLGERVKADIVAALLHKPKVLFLDEPTIGLDVTARAKVREFLRELHRLEAVTIVLTSHDMADVTATCDRLVMVKEGTTTDDMTVPEYIKTRRDSVNGTIEFLNPSAATAAAMLLRGDAEKVTCTLSGSKIDLRFNPAVVNLPEFVGVLSTLPEMVGLTMSEPSLDSIIEREFSESQ